MGSDLHRIRAHFDRVTGVTSEPYPIRVPQPRARVLTHTHADKLSAYPLYRFFRFSTVRDPSSPCSMMKLHTATPLGVT